MEGLIDQLRTKHELWIMAVDQIDRERQLSTTIERLQAIIEGQKEALYRLRHRIFYGGVEEVNAVIDKALALTKTEDKGE